MALMHVIFSNESLAGETRGDYTCTDVCLLLSVGQLSVFSIFPPHTKMYMHINEKFEMKLHLTDFCKSYVPLKFIYALLLQ